MLVANSFYECKLAVTLVDFAPFKYQVGHVATAPKPILLLPVHNIFVLMPCQSVKLAILNTPP